jgi:hypothetical protein
MKHILTVDTDARRVLERLASRGPAMLGLAAVFASVAVLVSSSPGSAAAPASRAVVHASGGNVLLRSAFLGKLPVMTQRYVGKNWGLEPSIAISRDGSAFYNTIVLERLPAGGSGATGLNLAFRTRIFRSTNLGATWKNVTPRVGPQELPPRTSDPIVHADPATGRVFSIDMNDGCMWLISTDDKGASWSQNPLACGVPVNDHQTLFTGPAAGTPTVTYSGIVYVCSHQYLSTILCGRSLDGGRTFLAGAPATVVVPGDERWFAGFSCDTIGHGQGAASYAADGTVYLPQGSCGRSLVHISRNAGLTWETVVVDRTAGLGAPWSTPDEEDPSVAVDDRGNAYYLWLAADGLPRLAVSRDHGRTWSPPMAVQAPGVRSARFPAITAGRKGRIAFLYLGTTTAEYPAEESWNAYVGFSLNALDARPVFATTTANSPRDPLHRGSCVDRCAAAGGHEVMMDDFLDIQADPVTGRVWTSLVDLCNGACARQSEESSSSRNNRAAVGVQTGGSMLR